MFKLLRNIYRHFPALRSLFYVEVKVNVASTFLGYLWWILDPILLMAVYYFIIKIVFSRGGEDYHLFVLCGVVIWQTFSRSIIGATASLSRSASLIRQTKLPLQLYVLVPSLVQAFFCSIGLAIVALWNYQAIGLHTLSLIVLVLVLVLYEFALGLVLSISNVHVRDTYRFVPYALRLGFYLSPILYSAERIRELQSVPQLVKQLYFFNPMVYILDAARTVLLAGEWFQLGPIAVVFLLALALLQACLLVFEPLSRNACKNL